MTSFAAQLGPDSTHLSPPPPPPHDHKKGNACGTIGLFHAMGNTPGSVKDDSYLSKFFAEAKGKSGEEVGKQLEKSDEVEAAHVAGAEQGQSSAAAAQNTNAHFIAFVAKPAKGSDECRVWELDGRKAGPIDHGACAEKDGSSLLKDAAAVMKKFMKRDPEEIRFNMIAMCEKAKKE